MNGSVSMGTMLPASTKATEGKKSCDIVVEATTIDRIVLHWYANLNIFDTIIHYLGR